MTAPAPSIAGSAEPVLGSSRPAYAAEEEGIGDLVQRLVADGKAYANAEVHYYKTVGSERAKALKTPVILGALALFFAHAALLALVATLFVALATLMSDPLAGLVTVAILALLGGILGYLAYSKAQSVFGAKP